MPGEHIKEKTAQSSCSPGPVRNAEQLIRAMFCPDHYDLNGDILPSAITSKDLLDPVRGFSIQRRNYLVRESLESFVSQTISRKPERSLAGLALTFAHGIRAIQDPSGQQAFYIIDAAEIPNDMAHALMFCTQAYPHSIIKKVKKDLIENFSKLETISNIFPDLADSNPNE